MSRTIRNVPPRRYDSDNPAMKRPDGAVITHGACWIFKNGIMTQWCSCGCEQGGSENKRFVTKMRREFEKRQTRAQVEAALPAGLQTAP